MRRSPILIAICILFFGLLTPGLDSGRRLFAPPDTGEADTGAKVIRAVLGEMAHTAASYLWVKNTIYWEEWQAQGYDWHANTEVMTFIRLVTWLDPNFTQAYSFGGYHLIHDLNRKEEGMAFLKEGLSYNPRDFSLHWELAFAQFKGFENYGQAIVSFREALKSAPDAYQKRRCLLLLGECARRLGRIEEARMYFQAIFQLFPNDSVARQRLKQLEQKRN